MYTLVNNATNSVTLVYEQCELTYDGVGVRKSICFQSLSLTKVGKYTECRGRIQQGDGFEGKEIDIHEGQDLVVVEYPNEWNFVWSDGHVKQYVDKRVAGQLLWNSKICWSEVKGRYPKSFFSYFKFIYDKWNWKKQYKKLNRE